MQFGEIDIDSDLVASQEVLEGSSDTITQLSNGCLCCTVRDDLIKVLNKLVRLSVIAADGVDTWACFYTLRSVIRQATPCRSKLIGKQQGSIVKTPGACVWRSACDWLQSDIPQAQLSSGWRL